MNRIGTCSKKKPPCLEPSLGVCLRRTIAAAVLSVHLILPAFATTATPEVSKTLRDGNGRTVQVPRDPKRIACFYGPSYEKVFLLGSGDRVAAMSIKQTPWAHKLNPVLKNIVVMPSYSDPDVERILQLGIDLVFYWQWPQQTQKMAAAGIPVVCPSDGSRSPTSSDEFIERYKSEMHIYGEVLGEKAKNIAASYCTYYDQKIRRVLAITSQIPLSRRPTVYYITGRSIFGTQGGSGFGRWIFEMAGGNLVSKDLNQPFPEVSMEQIISWNPEVILVGGLISPEAVKADPRWQNIRALKEKRIYACPEGVFLWGHGSSEAHLFVLWLAKLLHPEKFREIDLEQEVKDYYARFYRYKLTNDEANRIIKRLPPT